MAVQTALEFRELISKSGLLQDSALEEAFAEAVPASSADAAKTLVKKGLLTRFQATMLLAGKYRGLMLGPYKLLDQLGQGGMGVVYLAEHSKLHRRVALKILPLKSVKDTLALERFYREARAVAALDHPNIVKAYDVGEYDGVHFLAMEYVAGVNLQTHLDKKGPLPWRVATDLIGQACQGLEHAHQRDLVHRDIKPGNLLVDRQNTLKILDLGLARCFRNEHDNVTAKFAQNEELTGSIDFMAPEVARGEQAIDIRSDIYSLGLTFFALVVGRAPYDGTPAQKLLFHQMKELPLLHELQPEVPAGLSNVLAHMIRKEPADRFASPSEVLEALAQWLPAAIAPPSTVRLRSSQTIVQAPAVQAPNGKASPTMPQQDALPQAMPEEDEKPAADQAKPAPSSKPISAVRTSPAPRPAPHQAPAASGAKTVAKPAAVKPVTKPVPKPAPKPVPKPAVVEDDVAEDDDSSETQERRRPAKGKKKRFKPKRSARGNGTMIGLLVGIGVGVVVLPLAVVGAVYAFSGPSQPIAVAAAARPGAPAQQPPTIAPPAQGAAHGAGLAVGQGGGNPPAPPMPRGPQGGQPSAPPHGNTQPPAPTPPAGQPPAPPPQPPSSGAQEPVVGLAAPEIDGEDLNGECFQLSDYRGNVVLLDFWGFWCPHCKKMIPHERELVNRMSGRPFALIGVNSDKDPAVLLSNLAAHQVNWRSFKNARSEAETISKSWGVRGWPSLFLIDHNGIIREKWVGAPEDAILDAKIEELVKQAEAARAKK